MATILQSPFVVQLILPFLLVFAVVFAVLQKAKIFGEGKRQIDAIVAFSIALIFVAFIQYVNIIVQLAAFLGMMLIVLLVVMLLIGMLGRGNEKDFPKWFTTGGAVISVIAVVIAMIFITGAWGAAADFFKKFGNSDLVFSVITLVIALGAVLLVVYGAKQTSSSSGSH